MRSSERVSSDRLDRPRRVRPRAYPLALPIIFVVAGWSALELSTYSLVRPLLVAAAFGLVASAASALVFGPDRGAVLTVGLIGLVALPTPDVASAVFLAIVALVLTASILESRRAIRSPWTTVTRALNAFTAILAVVVLAQAMVFNLAIPTLLSDVAPARAAIGPSRPDTPDVYVLLLDAHIRPDELSTHFGVADSLQPALEERRFAIAEHSRSNYMATVQTLLSMLDEEHLTAFRWLADIDPSDPDYNNAIYAALNDNVVFTQFRDHGYEIDAIAPGWEVVALRSADRFVDTGEMSEFERNLFGVTNLAELTGAVNTDFAGDQLRARVRSNFGALVTLATERHDRPKFVLAHIPSPHSPSVFRRDGSARPAPAVENFDVPAAVAERIGIASYRQAYADQVAYVDQLAVKAIDEIQSRASRDYVLYVMSDHGARMPRGSGDNVHPDPDEATANLLTVFSRTPRSRLIDDRMTPVNVFRRYFSSVFGDDLPDLPNTIYSWAGRSRFNLVEIANPDE